MMKNLCLHDSRDIPIKQLVAESRMKVTVCEDCFRLIENAFDTGRLFFKKPSAEKAHNFDAAHFEGYRSMGGEYSAVPDRPDLCESFSVRARNASVVKGIFDAEGLSLHRDMCGAIELFDSIVQDTTRAAARYFGAAEGIFETADGSHLQLNYYLPQQSERGLLQDRHEDGLLLTVTRSTGPGLEIEKAGKFVPVFLDRNQVFVMVGEIFSLLTGGRAQPLYHRVLNDSNLPERMSLMYFSNPTPNSGQKIKPWVLNEKNRDVDIMRRAIENPTQFGLPSLV